MSADERKTSRKALMDELSAISIRRNKIISTIQLLDRESRNEKLETFESNKGKEQFIAWVNDFIDKSAIIGLSHYTQFGEPISVDAMKGQIEYYLAAIDHQTCSAAGWGNGAREILKIHLGKEWDTTGTGRNKKCGKNYLYLPIGICLKVGNNLKPKKEYTIGCVWIPAIKDEEGLKNVALPLISFIDKNYKSIRGVFPIGRMVKNLDKSDLAQMVDGKKTEEEVHNILSVAMLKMITKEA